jgi:hypothetical protein
VNDYSTGGNDAKTACMFALLADINANAGVPYNRLAVGFQTHVTAAPNQFPSKAALATNFQKLAALGANAMVTEIDIKISGTSSANERFQAAIWGDYLDVRTRFYTSARPPLIHTPRRLACTRRTASSSSTGTCATTCRGSAPRARAPSSTPVVRISRPHSGARR